MSTVEGRKCLEHATSRFVARTASACKKIPVTLLHAVNRKSFSYEQAKKIDHVLVRVKTILRRVIFKMSWRWWVEGTLYLCTAVQIPLFAAKGRYGRVSYFMVPNFGLSSNIFLLWFYCTTCIPITIHLSAFLLFRRNIVEGGATKDEFSENLGNWRKRETSWCARLRS